MSLCRILAVSCGYFAKLICTCTALYHSSTKQSPCLKLVSKSNLALISFVCGLQNSSIYCQMTSKHVSSGDKSQDMNWSIPKSPDQATTFLHFHVSESIANLQSNIFLHFIFHLMNLLFKLSSTVQFIFGPSMYGTYTLVGSWCCLMHTSCSLSDYCSKLVSFSGRTVSLVCGSHWVFLFASGILVLLCLWNIYKLSLYLF